MNASATKTKNSKPTLRDPYAAHAARRNATVGGAFKGTSGNAKREMNRRACRGSVKDW